jgi:hypothetical protein
MDIRFIFRNRWQMIKSVCRTLWGRPSVAMELLRLTSQASSGSPGVAEEGESPTFGADDSVDPRGQEKPHTGRCERPYRKPTLVGRSESSKANE